MVTLESWTLYQGLCFALATVVHWLNGGSDFSESVLQYIM